MTTKQLYGHIQENSLNAAQEFKRLFHGRGGLYKGFRHLTIDSIDTILSVAFYFDEPNEKELIEMLKEFVNNSLKYTRLVIQRRYLQGAPSEVLIGDVPEDLYLIENGIKIKLNLLSNKNSGYFPDMKNGRKFIQENAKGKHVLNLFAYTCAFSLAAKVGGARSVLNVDMSKGALKTGKANHILNDLDLKEVNFLSYNILKSFSALKRKGPYDFIIIDPPSFQKGSFETTKDYAKIIKKLSQLTKDNCTLLACLNSPELESDFIINMIEEYAPDFKFVKRLKNLPEFASKYENRSLKNLIFQKVL
ncbi:class I SAM-dependent methyltransferase [Sulfurimonas sp.]